LKGNYARNLNPGKGSKLEPQNIPNKDLNKAKSPAESNKHKEPKKDDRLYKNDSKEPDGWITPQKRRGFSRKYSQEKLTKPDIDTKQTNIAKIKPLPENIDSNNSNICKSCGKQFKLL
jgi:hypothetical protein